MPGSLTQLAEDLIGAAQEIIDALTAPEPEPEPIPNMVWIPPGTFIMGSPVTEAERGVEETQHEVTIGQGFWMGRYEVTQKDYWEVVDRNPSYFTNGVPATSSGTGAPVINELLHPVEQASWFEAVNYCALLTKRERRAGRLPEGYVYRLPTEAEWEYACRASTVTAFHYGAGLSSFLANFFGRIGYDALFGSFKNLSGVFIGRTVEVGKSKPNAWGLYDMHGNVWEWCQDWHGSYPVGPLTDPAGPEIGSNRVFSGGSWFSHGRYCRSAFRNGELPNYGNSNLGFRVILARPLP